MEEKIRKHVDYLFENAPKTKRVFDLKEELISNLKEKYQDLVKSGKTEQEAFENVISGIGDIDELLSELKKDANPINNEQYLKLRKRNALVVSLSVGLYILCLISTIVLEELGLPDFVSATSFFVIAGIATCILIYNFMSQPKYVKTDDTLVEEFKEWKSSKDKDKGIKDSVISTFWILVVGIYFIISFAFGAWAYSWIIFIIGAAVSGIIDLSFKLKE